MDYRLSERMMVSACAAMAAVPRVDTLDWIASFPN